MQVSVEVVSSLERNLTVEIPADEIESEVGQRLKKLKGRIKMDGFRKGKVPASIVEKRYGGSIRQEVIGDCIQKTLGSALQQESLEPASRPTINIEAGTPGQNIVYKATFEVYPEIALKSFDQISYEQPLAEVTEDDIITAKEKLIKQQAEWVEVDRASQSGDKLTISFKGEMKDIEDDGLSADDIELELGSKTMIEGFEDGLVGVKVGDTKVLKLTFPTDYHKKEFADKPVKFDVSISKITEAKLPELNQDFFDKLGIEDGSEEKMHQELDKLMKEELKKALDNKIKENLFEAVLNAHTVDCPKALIDEEVARLMQAFQPENKNNAPVDIPEIVMNSLKERAERNVGLGLIMKEIIKQQQITADKEKVKSKIEEIAKPYSEPEIIINWYYGDPNRLNQIEMSVIEEQVVENIRDSAKAEEKHYSYGDIVNF